LAGLTGVKLSENALVVEKLLSGDKRSLAYGYPKYYYNYGKDDLSKILDDDEVGELINSTVKRYLKSNCGYSFSATGDTHISVFQNGADDPNDYTVIVSRGYEEYQTGNEDCIDDDE